MKEEKSSKSKKIVAFLMSTVLICVSGIVSDATPVQAATQTQDHGFMIDENLFTVHWCETGRIFVYSSAQTYMYPFIPGTYLGYAYVYAGFATSRQKIDGKLYQRVLIKADMVPQTVDKKTNKAGMSQYLTVEVQNMDAMQNKSIEPSSSSGSTSYSTTGSVGSGISLGVSNKGGTYTLNGGLDFTLGISSTSSYTENALSVITNIDDNGYAVWNYDYISSGKNKAQNAYLFGSSTQYGLFSWNMQENLNARCGCLILKVTATFGGGQKGTTNRAYNKFTGAYNLGTANYDMYITWR